jgi:putative ubiquitin-RnfH superfamily antitoxin RatB of RatAB toxin-antitoxin module
MTALEAVEASGLITEFPELAGCELPLGIYGCRVESGQSLRDGDRVEIYRPLRLDPREARRRSVQAAGRTRSPRTARRR